MMQDIPTPRAFRAIRSVDVGELSKLAESELRPLLPCLVRMALCSPLDESPRWTEARKEIQKILSGMDVVSSIVALLSVDFSLLEQDAIKEQQLRRKIGGGVGGASVLVESLQNGLALEFERSEPARRLRLILSELLRIMSQVSSEKEFLPEKSEIFECEVYLEEVSDVICIAQAELPSLLQLDKVAEALLRVKYGPWLLCRLVASAPDNFEQVCLSLLSSGEIQDESSLGGIVRTQALRQLCAMNPHYALVLRSEAVRLCRLPGLAVALTYDLGLDYSGVSGNDLVAFLSGLLLGSDAKVRNWFAEFIRVGQKKSSSSSVLSALRNQLLKEVSSLVPSGVRKQLKDKKLQLSDEVKQDFMDTQQVSESHADKETLEILQAMDVSTDFEVLEEKQPSDDNEKECFGTNEINEDDVLRATALLRLYCALKGLARLKLTNQEAEELLCLITSHPPTTATGVRFVVVGLCTLLACTYIVSSPEHEQVAVKWIEWLSKEESHYETASGVHASFGEILLLVAIHFHSNQLEAITDLVCSTLGMKIRLGHLSRMKTLFTQELFTEKVVTAHGVAVPVTPELSADITGFLPIHCIHQLLKSRSFTKHSVPVKDWVYNQICSCTTPLHPLMVPLVEAFVHSIINPLSATKTGRNKSSAPTVEGFTEAQVASVFQSSREETPLEVESARVLLRRRSSVWVTSEDKSVTWLAPQLLMLYYVLTYQDCLLSNMKTIVGNNTQFESYTPTLLAKIPIKHLLQKVQSQQDQFQGLYAPLLRLLVTHYPHLCQVGDWLEEEQLKDDHDTDGKGAWFRSFIPATSCSPLALKEALSMAATNPSPAMLNLSKLETLEPSSLIPYVDVLVQSLSFLLEPNVPRRIQTLCCNLWSSLNTVIPRKLWLATVNSLGHADSEPGHVTPEAYTDEDLTRDPLTVLRCDCRVFRCPPLFDIICRILTAYLAASRALLSQYLQSHPAPKGNNSAAVEQEREELRRALVDAQESAAIQILLEVCLPTQEDKQANGGSMKSCAQREIQCRVCSLLHQMFIADPNIAKLVHFQGYPSELLPISVAGIPSMHICLDFIPELLNQPQLEKQLFAVQLAAYLSIQYPLPKAMNVAKYILSRMTSLLAALPASKRASFFIPALPALVLFCRAFPPLRGDTCAFLVQLGKVASSHAAASTNCTLGERSSLLKQLLENHSPLETAELNDHGFTDQDVLSTDNVQDVKPVEYFTKESETKLSDSEIYSRDVKLCQAIEKTFAELVNIAVVKK